MPEYDVIHIAAAPQSSTDASLVGSVAAILKKDPYDTRLLLAGKIPKIIAHYDNMQMAKSIVQGLKELGLAAMALKASDLRQPAHVFKARDIEILKEEILFRDEANHKKRIGSNNVSLIIEGTIQTTVELPTTKRKTKLSLTGTLLTGGIPIWRKFDEKTTTKSIQAEYYIRLYEYKPAGSVIEILQKRMNYSFLGVELEASSNMNFNKVVSKLRELFPQAIFDNRLMKHSAAITYSGRAIEDMEINCKLIYLFHLMATGLRQDNVVES